MAIERDPAVLAYGPGGGYGPLREWLGARHGVEPARVVVTNGGLQGFLFYAEELLAERPGRVLVEAPTYDRPLKLLARLGAEVVPVPMDDEGLDPEALERELAAGATSFLYTIPTFQNPSGRTLSAERRRRLAELAAEHDLPVLEDDPYGLVRYEGDGDAVAARPRGRRASSRTPRRSRRRSRPVSASAGSSRLPRSPRAWRRVRSRPTSRRRFSPRRPFTS